MYDFRLADPALMTFGILRQTWAALNKAAETRLAKAHLTPEKVAVLWACRDYPGTVTPAELSRLVFRENQTVAGLLNRMEKEGLVKRVPKRKGHPFTEVKLTAKGEKACGPGIQVMKGVVKDLVATMPQNKQEQLQKLLLELRDRALDDLHMEPSRVPRSPEEKAISVKW